MSGYGSILLPVTRLEVFAWLLINVEAAGGAINQCAWGHSPTSWRTRTVQGEHAVHNGKAQEG